MKHFILTILFLSLVALPLNMLSSHPSVNTPGQMQYPFGGFYS